MADIEEVLKDGWAEHDSQPLAVAERLESAVSLLSTDAEAARFMQLASHAVGDHAGDRERALAICEAAATQLGEANGSASLEGLAVARYLAGRVDASMTAEADAGQLAENGRATSARIRLRVAEGLSHSGDWGSCTALFNAGLEMAAALPEGTPADRTAAVVSNNVASTLMELPDRTPAQDELMERAAQAAKTYWLRAGTALNDARADYLLSRVFHSLGRHDDSREAAERGIATLESHGDEPVDAAFLQLARAAACRDLPDAETHAEALAAAEQLRERFPAELLDWFDEELAKAR